MRLPYQHRRGNPAMIAACLAALLLVAAGAVYLFIYHEGDAADKNAQNLLAQYNQASSGNLASSRSAASTPQADETQAGLNAGSLPPQDSDSQPEAPDVAPADALVALPGYDIIGKLTIAKIGLELPVISKTTEKALKASICYYGGAKPGEKGNMVITGHNYANGAHFGKLDQLKLGDIVVFGAPGGAVYRYDVYQTLIVKPDDLAALNQPEGDYALTLVTCASSGNRRLLVRCKLADS